MERKEDFVVIKNYFDFIVRMQKVSFDFEVVH